MPTKDEKTAANEAAEQARTEREALKALADRATNYLDKDRVTVAQAKAYRDLLGDSPLETLGLDQEAATGAANKTKLLPKEDQERIRQLYSGLTPSHQWLKAVVATALALENQEEEAQGGAPGSPPHARQTDRGKPHGRLLPPVDDSATTPERCHR
jgi:hypothetical protein